jgi:hypothetical protein
MRGVCGVFRRQHEGRLRQIEFGGDRLHLLARQALRVEHHCERIAAELLGGEHVDGLKLQMNFSKLLKPRAVIPGCAASAQARNPEVITSGFRVRSRSEPPERRRIHRATAM